jgi:CRISPR-associated protein Csx10
MRGFGLRLQLLDDVAVGQPSGGPALDYLPGSLLLGAAAAALYRKLPRENAFMLFHSGCVRFGNGLPLAPGDEPAWPVPLCWYRDRAGPSGGERWPGERIVSRLHRVGEEPGRGLHPLAEGYVTETGGYLRPRTGFRAKTPVAGATPDGGRPFGYAVLLEGQSFLADIAWEDSAASACLECLYAFFDAAPVLLLGRSRSAQFGRVACEVVEVPPAPASLPDLGEELVLWLLSDLAALDGQGFPTLAPTAEDLGLPPAEPVPEQTFIQTRRYAPYNRHHQLYGSERQVIRQGSVLTYRLRGELDAATRNALAARLARGLGGYREFGLGRSVLAPTLLAEAYPAIAATPDRRTEPVATVIPVPDHPLARWLQVAAEHGSIQGGLKQWVECAIWELDELERNARRLSGLREDQSASPGKAPWGRVAEAARRALQTPDGPRRLHGELFTAPNAVCRPLDEDWDRPTATRQGQPLTYRQWLQRKLAERPDDAAPALRLLAEMAQRRRTGRP